LYFCNQMVYRTKRRRFKTQSILQTIIVFLLLYVKL
jgi:hypothetical protein